MFYIIRVRLEKKSLNAPFLLCVVLVRNVPINDIKESDCPMALERSLMIRSKSKCELCSGDGPFAVCAVSPRETELESDHIFVCQVCQKEMQSMEILQTTSF